MFRLQCWRDIGGYRPYGHEDCLAAASTSRAGWRTRSFPRLMGEHHVPYMGYAPRMKYKLPVLFRMGRMDYIMRTPGWAESVVCAAGMASRPYVISGAWRMAGYISAAVRKQVKVPPESSWFEVQKDWIRIFYRKIRRMVGR